MGFVFDFLQGIAKAIPVLISKIVTVLLGLFTAGLFLGYWLSVAGVPAYYLLLPLGVMALMWYKLDEGFLALLLLVIAAIFYPNALGL